MSLRKKPRLAFVLIIVFASLALIAVILFATPLKTYTNGFLTAFYTDETAEESEERFDDIDERVKELADELDIEIQESDRSNRPSLDYILVSGNSQLRVTFSNTEGYLNMTITCQEYMAADKNVLSEFYNSFCFSNVKSLEIIHYIEQLSANSKTMDPIYFNSSGREYMEMGLDGLVLSGAVETNIF